MDDEENKPQYIRALDDLLDDLTVSQYHDLIVWLWVNRYPVTRADIKGWRRKNGLSVSET